MTKEQKTYIEENIDLIENNQWEQFFEEAPAGIGGVLYEAGIDFMTPLGYVPPWAFHSSELETVVVPDGVTIIHVSAFSGCKYLTNIEIPNSVTSIASYAFYYCRKLTSIVFTGTVVEWNNIDKRDRWDCDTGHYRVQCTDGIV